VPLLINNVGLFIDKENNKFVGNNVGRAVFFQLQRQTTQWSTIGTSP